MINKEQIKEIADQIRYASDPESLKLLIADHTKSLKKLISSLVKEQTQMLKDILPILSLPSPTPPSIVAWIGKLVTGTAAPQLKAQVKMVVQIAELASAMADLISAIQEAYANLKDIVEDLKDLVDDIQGQIEGVIDDIEAIGDTSLANIEAAQTALNTIAGSTVSNFDTSSVRNLSNSAAAEIENLDANVSQFVDTLVDIDEFVFADRGTANTPSFTFTENQSTGLFSPSNNIIAFSTNGTEALRIGNTGNISIGSPNTSLAKLVVSNIANSSSLESPSGTVLHVVNEANQASRLVIDQYGASEAPNLVQRKSRGTPDLPSALLSGDVILNNGGFGRGSTAFTTTARAQMSFATEQNWTDSAHGTKIVFSTTKNDTTTLTERFSITNTGAITSSDLPDAVGYKGIPQNPQTSAYTLALSDIGKHISITTGGVVIPANDTVAFPIGSTIVIFNNSASTQTISITTDTLRQSGLATTGTRTLAIYGVATCMKVASTVWVVTGDIT